MRAGITGRWAAVIALLLAGCVQSPAPQVPATLPPSEPATLPPPRIHITQESSPPESALLPSLQPTATRPPPPTDLQELARSTYGDRLIEWVSIPSIQVKAPVIAVGWQTTWLKGEKVEWDSPEASVGWAVSSGLPGGTENIILYGHNNLHSNVFMRLSELQVGAEVQLDTGQSQRRYRVKSVEILPVTGEGQDEQAYQAIFQPGNREVLTLLSCWPPTDNTHRVVILAEPDN